MIQDDGTTLAHTVQRIQSKTGRVLLSDEDVLLLMADSLCHTTTFEELRFLQPDARHE